MAARLKERYQKEVRKKIQDEIAAARKAMESGDIESIRSATQNLVKASQKIGEEMYKKTAGAAAGTGAAGAESTDSAEPQGNGQAGGENQDRVVDAEYTEVDKDKK